MRQVCTSSAWPPGTSMTLPLSCKARTKVRRLTWRSPHQLTKSLTNCITHTSSHVTPMYVPSVLLGCCNRICISSKGHHSSEKAIGMSKLHICLLC